LIQSVHPTRKRMLRVLLPGSLVLFAAIGASTAAEAAIYHVRTDGGSASQCTGLADAAYPGSGSNQACAWNHPFVALPPGKAARIAGGDTLIVGPGDYMMGIGAPESDRCSSSYAYDCHLPPIPSGPSPSQPTRILGKGHDSGCAAPPQLWGTERAYTVLNLRGSNNVHVGCFEITDRAACIMGHGAGMSCPSSGQWARTGIIARDSSNVLLRDLNVHGLAYAGVQAGRLSNWTTERLTLRANGWVGWDGDIGAFNSSNSGNMIFREANISWNGCTENHPSTNIVGCWAQAKGGYGDGIGTHQTGGHWLFEDSIINHNTSDGLDLLYMADGGSITIRRSWFEGNAGQQVKTKGNARIENSVIVGNCAYFSGRFPAMDGDHCRALGSAVSVGLFSSSRVDIINNTISSQGDCLVVSGGGDSSARLNFANNAMIGERDWLNGSRQSCLHYSTGSAVTSWNRDQIQSVRNNACPAGSRCGEDIRITNRSYDGFDPTPLSGSPLVDNASTAAATASDYYNFSRTVGHGPDIGAVERGGAGTTPPAPTPGPTPAPPPAPAPVPTPDPIPDPAGMAVVSAVTVQSVRNGNLTQHTATVRILNGSGMPIAGATVVGRWSWAGARTGQGETDAGGSASIQGGQTRADKQARFCVTDVIGSQASFQGEAVCSN
jgi:hypothetical protein